jgi:hypothetical protein
MRKIKDRRATPTYYVRFDTYWQGSPDRWAGPFDTRGEAQEAIDLAVDTPHTCAVLAGQTPGDIKHAVRVYGVSNKSQAERLGMRDHTHDTTNVVGMRVPTSTDDLFEIEQR